VYCNFKILIAKRVWNLKRNGSEVEMGSNYLKRYSVKLFGMYEMHEMKPKKQNLF